MANPLTDLHQRAELVLLQRAGPDLQQLAEMTPAVAQRMLHDLQIHQIELEIQNDELRRMQTELDRSRAHYFDLFDLAPVGYCTIRDSGLILKANLTLASLLGSPRGQLLVQRFSAFILREDQDIFYRHRPKSRETTATATFEVRMLRTQALTFWARIELKVLPAEKGPP